MQKLKLMLSYFTLCLLTLTCASLAQAGTLPQRTFVSAARGNDNNSCTVAAPCRSFNTALNRVQAGGEVVALDSGEYGVVVITKAVTLEAQDAVDAILTARSTQDAVTIQAGTTDTTVLRGLTISGQGGYNGITFNSGGALHVESCVISGFSFTGIYFAVAAQLFVKDSIVRDNGGFGIYVIPPVFFATGIATASIDHCWLEKNNYGLDAGTNSKVTIRDSIAAGNTATGYIAGNSPAELSIENCIATGNLFGIYSTGGSTIRISNVMVTDNSTGLANDGYSTIISFGNNRVRGNGTDKSGTITVVPQS